MGCCIAIAMVIAAVRGVWFRLFPHRRPPETGFAPPAYRPAPGALAPVAPTRPTPVVAAAVPAGAAPWPAVLLGAAAITVAVYAAAIELLGATGTINSGAPMFRHLVLAAIGLAALTGAATCSGRSLPPARGPGVVLTSAGATWTVLSLADMHLFEAIRSGHHGHSGHSGTSLLVHGLGFGVLAIGLGHLLRPHDPMPDGSPLRTATTVRTP